MEQAVKQTVEDDYIQGLCFAHGLDRRKNTAKAVFHYHRAAKRGHSEAQCFLGEILFYGCGCVKPNKVEGLKWLRVSARGGDVYAKTIIRWIGEQTCH